MLHQYSHDNIDQDKLSHQDKDNEEEGGNILIDATISETVIWFITFFSECVFHDTIPIITFFKR